MAFQAGEDLPSGVFVYLDIDDGKVYVNCNKRRVRCGFMTLFVNSGDNFSGYILVQSSEDIQNVFLASEARKTTS